MYKRLLPYYSGTISFLANDPDGPGFRRYFVASYVASTVCRRSAFFIIGVVLLFLVVSCSSNEPSPVADSPGAGESRERALALSEEFTRELSSQEQYDFSELQEELYAQAQGDSLHFSFLLARLHEGTVHHRDERYESAMDILSDVYKTADSLGYDEVKLRTMPAKLSILTFRRQQEEAQQLIDRGIELAQELEDKGTLLLLRSRKASLLAAIGQFNEALNIYYDLADIYKQQGDRLLLSSIYGSIALLFSDIENIEESVKWHEKALAIQQSAGYTRGLRRTLNNLAIAYEKAGRYEQAIERMEESLAISHELGHLISVIRTTYNIGNNYRNKEKYEEAIKHFERALQLSQENGVEPGKMYSKMGLGKAYYALGNLDTAYHNLIQANRLGHQMDAKPILSNTYSALYKIAKQRSEFQQALAYLEEYQELSDEFNEMARNRALDELIIEHNVETTRAENRFLAETLALQRQASRNKTASIVFLCIILLILIGFTYYFFRTRKKLQIAYLRLNHQKEHVARKNKELQQVSKEREAFLHIIVHDLRNPLSAISGTIELLQMYRQKQTGELIDIMDQSAKRMHLLIDSLLRIFERENVQIQKEAVVISDIIHKTMSEHAPHAERKNIELAYSLPDFEVRTHRESIENIVSNLLSNAIKYTPKNRRVELKLYRDQHFWFIYIRDEGPGFSEADRKSLFKLFARLSARPTDGETSSGVGLYSVKMLVRKLGGEIKLLETDGRGAAFLCRFPFEDDSENSTRQEQDSAAVHSLAASARQDPQTAG